MAGDSQVEQAEVSQLKTEQSQLDRVKTQETLAPENKEEESPVNQMEPVRPFESTPVREA